MASCATMLACRAASTQRRSLVALRGTVVEREPPRLAVARLGFDVFAVRGRVPEMDEVATLANSPTSHPASTAAGPAAALSVAHDASWKPGARRPSASSLVLL
jgi:hypothetical protein